MRLSPLHNLEPFFLFPKPEKEQIKQILDSYPFDSEKRQQILHEARDIISHIRGKGKISLADKFMATYSLSREEGRALMELAETLLRIPDAKTRNLVIQDKLSGGNWLNNAPSALLRLTGKSLDLVARIIAPKKPTPIKNITAALAMPVIRPMAVTAMRVFGRHFIMASSIDGALKKAEKTGDLCSFDMLGEGARTEEDAEKYLSAYEEAIRKCGEKAKSPYWQENHGVSVKLSALFPRYETMQATQILEILPKRLGHLMAVAQKATIGLTVDAEEAGRLSLSLAVIDKSLALAQTPGGFGLAVQAYNRDAKRVIELISDLARKYDHPLSVRLVKGAYWDSEIRIAQQKGLADFPVYTRKAHSDLAYLHLCHDLLKRSAHIFPQFATHNAHALSAIRAMASDMLEEKGNRPFFELQRLHGMGKPLHEMMVERMDVKSRIYAPVGSYDNLLAYLVRRLLENGANSSFVNRLADLSLPVDSIAGDPFDICQARLDKVSPIKTGSNIFHPIRKNSLGHDFDNPAVLDSILKERAGLSGDLIASLDSDIKEANLKKILPKLNAKKWRETPLDKRSVLLHRLADFYEENSAVFLALLAREGRKTLQDAIDEIREAVDFCRYYASKVDVVGNEPPRGLVVAISPWNFPLAIFTGQIVAGLVSGNVVLGKPAEQTSRIAAYALKLMRKAGLDESIVNLVYGDGKAGAVLIKIANPDMVVFTGSLPTAKHIEALLASGTKPAAPLIAETGGLNAMIVDSTALPEHTIDDIITSAFQSAGQRCSALRMLYIQDDIYETILTMLKGAANLLQLGDPLDIATDVGPVIDQKAHEKITRYIEAQKKKGRLIWQAPQPALQLSGKQGVKTAPGFFIAPALIGVNGIADLCEDGEIFGPVLHIAPFARKNIAKIIKDINQTGYGLTFGLRSSSDSRQLSVSAQLLAGNVYINRNQIGAIVGSQPFGGTGFSGTGPKAGGPIYLRAFVQTGLDEDGVRHLARRLDMPGPDGERNFWSSHARGRVLTIKSRFAGLARDYENDVVALNSVEEMLKEIKNTRIDAILADDLSSEDIAIIRKKIAMEAGIIIPLIVDSGMSLFLLHEKHVSNDITAVGGNPELLALSE